MDSGNLSLFLVLFQIHEGEHVGHSGSEHLYNNMPKRYRDQSRGSMATKLGLKSPFWHLQAVYSNLALLVERNRHPLKLAQEMKDSWKAPLAEKRCSEGRGSTWSQRAVRQPGM